MATIGTPGLTTHRAVNSPRSSRLSRSGFVPREYELSIPKEDPTSIPTKPSVTSGMMDDFAIHTEVNASSGDLEGIPSSG